MNDFNKDNFEALDIRFIDKLRFLRHDIHDKTTKAHKWNNRATALCALSFLAILTAGAVDDVVNPHIPTYEERVEDQFSRFAECLSPVSFMDVDIKVAYPEYKLDDYIEKRIAMCRVKYPMPLP